MARLYISLFPILISALTNSTFALPKPDTVYQCAPNSDVPHFTDLGCGNKRVIKIKTLDTLKFAPLTRAEQLQLDQQKVKRPRTNHQSSVHPVQNKKNLCKENAKKIAALRDKRRKGYRLSESRSLDLLEKKLVAIRSSQCM